MKELELDNLTKEEMKNNIAEKIMMEMFANLGGRTLGIDIEKETKKLNKLDWSDEK